MSNNFELTDAQKRVRGFCGEKNMLVSASAGTGKTTTMIECIASLLHGASKSDGIDVSEIVVVTFTNLAAAEMKAKLAQKLSEMCADNSAYNKNMLAEQLEKLENASICTLHSFCSDLLRNYFYVVDLDPAFAILDTLTVSTLRKNALDDLFAEYFARDDAVFREIYKIFSTNRQEDNFRDTLLRLYDFSQCLEDFDGWYAATRQNFVTLSEDNEIARLLRDDIEQMLTYYAQNMEDLAHRAEAIQQDITTVCLVNAGTLREIAGLELQEMLNRLYTLVLEPIPSKKKGNEFDDSVREHYQQLKKDLSERIDKYNKLVRGEPLETLWGEMAISVRHVDKLVELVDRFRELFGEEKRQRGGVDFNDLEHFTIRLLDDPDALQDIRRRYKLIFVDEYQDTNPVQEAIINKLSVGGNLFMVGDVKQSIYGFRGCEPSIFAGKYDRYKKYPDDGEAVELNDNFRSNSEILHFVNELFNGLMTERFGAVDYFNTAQLHGTNTPSLATPSVRIDVIARPATEKKQIRNVYDITAETATVEGVRQGELIANRIKEYVGKSYFVKADGNKRVEKKIGYGDVVILMRNMTGRALDIYNTLVDHNIPVAASFKTEGYSNKEVRDVINLLRVIDNPYNDVYMVGACLTFGKLTEQDLVPIRLDTEGRVPFCERLLVYAEKGSDGAIVNKIRAFLQFLDKIRFYSYGASVCETVLKVFELTDYRLTVQQLPNGNMRLNKLNVFVDSLKGASYAQSVDRFLAYIDEMQEQNADVQIAPNAVRMMTMHASKGLEFPVVIIAGLETGFNFDRYALKANSRLGVALDYYNFGTMRTSQTVGAFVCDTVNQLKQREEEMRLLYVAMTRAKFVLDLVASVDDKKLTQIPKQPTHANSHFDWLHGMIYGKYSGVEVAPNVEINLFDRVETAADNAESELCQQTVTVEQVREKLSYTYPYANETQMPSKVVSSALDKEYIDLTEEPQTDFVLNSDSNRNEIGSAYHKVYQYVDYSASAEEVSRCIAALVNEERIAPDIAEQLDARLIADSLHNPQLQGLLRCGKVYHEIPFMLYAPYSELSRDKRYADDVMLQGVIDLLVMGENRAVVIDFKYTTRSDLVQERYTAQLNSYKLAVQRICGVRDVDCYVFSIADNLLIKM